MKKTMLIILLALLGFIPVPPALAEDLTGTVAKVPFPLDAENISLEKQKVLITVYSTFIQVTAEYSVKNNNPQEKTFTMGFPVNIHSGDMEKAERPILNFSALTGKKDEDYFVREEIDGDPSPEKNGLYKKWYKWDMDLGSGHTARIKLNYYISLSRNGEKAHLIYRLKPAGGYSGNIKHSEISVNMPVDCRSIPFTMNRDYSGGDYVYSSLPRPAINKNLLQWNYSDMVPSEDLIIHFACKSMPRWTVKCSGSDQANGNICGNIMDGNPKTMWATAPDIDPINSWIDFIPENGNPRLCRIAMVPGNSDSLTDFYRYSHVREATMTVEPGSLGEKQEENTESSQKKEQKKRNIKNEPRFEIECTADCVLQEFKCEKAPLDTAKGPIRMIIDTIYPGQESSQTCISEMLLFDRQPNETYESP